MKKILSILSVILFTGSLWTANAAPAEGTYWKETFSKMGSQSLYNTTRTYLAGDSSIYSWYVRSYQHNSGSDVVDGVVGVRLKYVDKNTSNYVEHNGAQEGGIKSVYFKWRLPGSGSKTVKFYVALVDIDTHNINKTKVAAGGSYSYECEESFADKEAQNAKLKISVQSGSEPVIFGPISIVPYLLFTNKAPKVDASVVTSFDLKTIWINNTTSENQITFAVTDNTTGGAATITDGVIDLSDVTSSGSMKITATWGKVTTTTTLIVTLPAPEEGTFWKETFSKLAIGSSYITSNTDVEGDSSVYAWSLYDFRRNGESKDGELGVRLGTDASNYIQFNGNQEGGIQYLYFKWAPAGSNVNYNIEVSGDGLSPITRTVTGAPYACAQKLNVAQNAKLKLSVNSGSSDAIVFYHMSVVPYLLFTDKTPEVDASAVDTFDLKKILINNTTGATPTFTVSDNTTGGAASISNGVIDLSDVTTSGSMKITATWGSVTTTTTLAVAAIPTPTIELDNAEVAINGSYVPQPVVKIGETVVENPTITYESSNANVATVDGSTFTLLGTGTSTITVTVVEKENEYKQAQKAITLTVTAVAPAEGKFWKETFSKLADTDGYVYTEPTPVTGDSNVYAWSMRNYRHKNHNDDMVDGERGVRIAYKDENTNNYIEFKGNQEGGIKDLYFKWSQAGSKVNYKIEITGEGLSTVSRTITGVPYVCAQKLNVAQNAKLKIYVTSSGDGIVFGPISVVPYLLFTNKAPKADVSVAKSFDLKTILIDNTEATPEYEVTENTTGSAATITDGVIALNDVATSGIIKITATWGKVTTTTTLTVTLPTPTITLENAEVAINGSYEPQPVVKIGEEVVQDPVITYASSNANVATVDASGNFILLGTGTSTITVTVAAKDYTYQQAKKDITLTVTAVAPEEGTFWKETFSKMATVEDYNVERTLVAGDSSVYEWYARNYTHKYTNNDDNIGEEWGVRLGYEEKTNNYIEFNNKQEGGIKDLYFKWRLPGSGNKPVKFNVEVLETTNDFTRSINLTDVAAGKYSTYECAQKLNVEKNAKIKLSVQNGCEAVIFGNILVVPYLLYTQKTDTLDLATATTSKNEALIDNRTDANAIEYSIVSGDATIDDEGTVTATTVGTVKVQAKWGDVTTTYKLKVINSTQYNLTWNADGGELSGGTPAGLVTVGDSLTAPTATKVGYNHTGWNPEVPEVMPANDFTSKATYTAKKCNITLKSNYEGGADDIEFVATYNMTSPVAGQAELFARTGYSIKEGFWKNAESEASGERLVNSTGEYTKGVNGYTDANRKWIYDAEEDITLYAHWQATSYTITYANMSGATNFEGAPATYTIETPTISLGTPTKTGYYFAGWKVTNAQGEDITEIAQGSTGNKTLWATWTAKKCTITLKCNYKDGPADVVFTATYGQASPLSSSDIHTRENYSMKEGYWKNAESEASGERLVNSTGVFTKEVNGYTDANRKWIHDAEEDITLYAHWTSTMPNISLNDNEDNSATIAANAGKKANVTTNRTIGANMFNTICLPFDVDAEQMATVFGEDYQLVEFTSAMLNEGKNELNIRFNTVENLEAGVPYLIKVSEKKENISFSEVQIENTTGTSVGEDIKMHGIMSPTILGASEKSHLIVVANDKLSWVTANDSESLKGMRAYLKVENEQVQAAIRRSNPRLVLNGTDTATDMVNVNANVNVNRKLLINGQLYIECNGRLYNVLGY